MKLKDVHDLLEWVFYSWLPIVLFSMLITAVTVESCMHPRARRHDPDRAGEGARFSD